MNISSSVIMFCETYLICMLLFFIIFGKKRKDKYNYQNSVDLKYIIQRYNINVKKLPYNLFLYIMNISNSFIIAITFTIMLNTEKYFYRIMIGFVIIFILIYVVYSLIGNYFKKKEE